MKNQFFHTVLAIGFAAIIANTAAVAQTNHTASIPFAFEAGGSEYASGTYEIRLQGTGRIVRLTNVTTGATQLVNMPVPLSKAPGASESPKLVFQTTAEGYRLEEVWLLDRPGMRTAKSSKSGESASVKVSIK